jgi:hypothetical protein
MRLRPTKRGLQSIVVGDAALILNIRMRTSSRLHCLVAATHGNQIFRRGSRAILLEVPVLSIALSDTDIVVGTSAGIAVLRVEVVKFEADCFDGNSLQ